MKNWILIMLMAGILIVSQSCEKAEDDYMNSIPDGIHLLKQVTTHYLDHAVVDTFFYNSNYEIISVERRNGDVVNRFYFENKKLKEGSISIKENGEYVAYDVSYMMDGTLTITNNTTAYLFTDDESGYYKQLNCLTREPFGEWSELYTCEYDWNFGNLSSSIVNREVTHFNYDDKANPMAGYIVWGFFFEDLFIGTINNRLENDYLYEYNDKAYPIRLTTLAYTREYFYHQNTTFNN